MICAVLKIWPISKKTWSLAHPSAVIANCTASRQAGVEICDAIWATHRSILVDPTATIHITASSQVSVGQSECRPEEKKQGRGGAELLVWE